MSTKLAETRSVTSLVFVSVLALLACKGGSKSREVEGTFEGKDVVFESVDDVAHNHVKYPNKKVRVTISAARVTVEVSEGNTVEWRCEASVERHGDFLREKPGSGKCVCAPSEEFGGCYPTPKLGGLQIAGLDSTKKLDLIILPGERSESNCPAGVADESISVGATL